MQHHLPILRDTAFRVATMLIAGATLASACGSGPLGVDSEITVEVSGAGDGDGLVQGSAPADIYCTITHGEVTGANAA